MIMEALMLQRPLYRVLHPSSTSIRLSITMLRPPLRGLLPLSLLAQTNPDTPATPPPPKSTMMVTVPVLVLEKKGQPAASPAKDQLTISEDGAAQSILTLAPAA